MLPFMKKNIKQPGLIVTQRKPDSVKSEDSVPEEGSNAAMKAAAQDILRAISDNDPEHLALAMQAAYDICESNESPQDDEEDYDSQNQKAASEQQE